MIDIKLDTKVARIYTRLQQSAKDRGLEFDLSLMSLRNILKAKKCYYTGKDISTWHDREDEYKLTIDRVDNDKGYITGNVVACSHTFNQKKGNLTVQEIQILFKKVLK